MESRAVLFFFFLSEIYERYYDPKKYKSAHNLRNTKKKKICDRFTSECTCGSNTSLKFQIKIVENERGIAEMPFSPFFVENTSIYI